MAEPTRPRRPVARAVRRAVRLAALLLVAYAAAGFVTARLSVGPVATGPEGLERVAPDLVDRLALPEVWPRAGVLSVHTDRSHDAEGSVADVARAAQAAGVDFVVLGDHPGDWASVGVEALRPTFGGGGVLLVGGVELVIAEVGRVLVTGLDSVPRTWHGSVSDLLAHAGGPQGFVSVIHPRSPRARERWKAPGPQGVHAWEAMDVSEMARTRLADRWAGYHLGAFLGGLVVGQGHQSLLRLGREGFRVPGVLAYDSMRTAQPLAITAGVNHHPKSRILGGLFPAYGPFFRTVINHVLLTAPPAPEPGDAWAEVAGALREGRSYVSLGAAERAGGFRFGVLAPDSTWVGMGGAAPFRPGTRLLVRLPPGARDALLVRVLADGREAGWFEAEAGALVAWPAPAEGIYRVEVYRAGRALGRLRWNLRPWLLSNTLQLTIAPASP